MKKYTDEQIKKAIQKMPMMSHSGPVVKWELEMFRQFLDALPEPGWLLKLQGLTTDQDTINERLEQASELEAAQVPSHVFRTLIRMVLSGKIFIDDLRAFASHGIQLDDEARQEIATFWDKRHALPESQDEWERCEFSDIRKGDRVRAEFIDITYEGTAVDVRDYKIAIGHNRNEILRAWKNPDLYRIPAPVVAPDPEVNHFIRINGKDYEAIPDSGRYQLIESKWSSPMVLNVEHITEWEELELTPKVVEDE